VQTFNLSADAWSSRKPKKLFRFTVSFASATLLFFGLQLLVNRVSPRHGVTGIAIESVFWGLFMSLFELRRKNEFLGDYSLAIDDYVVSMKIVRSGKVLYQRSVNRENIRTIVERKRGLSVSEHGRVGAFILGRIWVPKKLHDYEYVKRLLMGWQGMDEVAGR
jgi:hypothetical protein